jgi:hypothetical protein
MRPSPAQAKAKVNEYIAFLEENGVPTALFKERVKDNIVDWGDLFFFWKASLSIELPLTAHDPVHPQVSSRRQPLIIQVIMVR